MRTYISCYILIASFLIVFSDQKKVSAEKIYRYVDKKGVAHYTNIHKDKRYKTVNLSHSSSPKQKGLVFKTSKTRVTDPQALKLRNKKGRKYAKNSVFDHHIRRAARAHRVDPLLIKAIIKTESGFNRYAVSPKGAQGLMQLMPATARYLKVKDPFDPWENIYGGTKYVKTLLKSFKGNMRLSLAAYNAGPTRVKKHNAVPRIPETIAYVGKVIRQYKAYKRSDKRKKYSRVPLTTSIRVRNIVTVN